MVSVSFCILSVKCVVLNQENADLECDGNMGTTDGTLPPQGAENKAEIKYKDDVEVMLQEKDDLIEQFKVS